MKAAEKFYISEILTITKEKLIKRIVKGKSIPSLYCIVGCAVSKQDAFVVLRRIVEDIRQQDSMFRIPEFFEEG